MKKAKLWKILLSTALCAVLAVLCLFSIPIDAQAAEVVESGTCGENLTWTLDSDGLLTISGTGPMTNYDWECGPLSPFESKSSIRKIVIEDGVTSIGGSAFYNCDSLISITIPDSVTSIGWSAFYECSSLQYNTYNGDRYLGNENNPYVVLIKGTNRAEATLHANLKIIYGSAFSNCSSLTSITIGDSVTSIGNNAFYNCSSLTSVTIPDSVTSIGNSAFEDCSSLVSITIPDSVTSIGAWAFEGCSSLTSIIIPDSVTSIGECAFYDCDSLTSVTIGDSVTSIGSDAFFSCNSLTSVTIGDSVTSIGDYAFYYCDSLTSITIPDGVTSIGEYAFADCSSLTSITIGDSVTSIGNYAFWSCSSLTAVYITDIAAWCDIDFENYDSNPLYYAHNLYLNDALVTDLVIPDGVTALSGYAFYNCDSLISITIGDSVTSIGYRAFYNCRSLVSITIPDSVTSIGNYAFSSCDSLTSITIPDSVTSIGNFAFSSCRSLTSVTIPDSITTIKQYTFADCSNLSAVGIPESVTSIGEYAFRDCDSLTSIIIPDSVTSIGYSAFYDCDSLTSVTIPDSVTSIGKYAFYGCSRINHIAYGGTEEQWAKVIVGGNNTALTNAANFHYETVFQEKENCVEYGLYCPACKLFVDKIVKEGGKHAYSGDEDLRCENCDFSRTPASITVSKLPDKLGYILFEESLDVTGGQLFVTYDDGSTGYADITADMVTGFDNTVIGVQTLTLTYGNGSTTYNVEILATMPESLSLATLPDKLSYIIGDTVDPTGLTLTAYYKDGQQATITASDVTVAADTTAAGVKIATATYQGLSVTFDIYVHERGTQVVDSSLYPESAHNYSDNMNETKTLTVPGATQLTLTFNSSSQTESGCDVVYILDGAGNQVARFDGNFSGSMVTVPGDTVQIRLTTDGSVTRYGYAFSKIEADNVIYHPEVAVPGYAATFAKPGLTDGTKCSICGEFVKPQEVLPQLVGRVANWNMTVSDDLTVNFYLEISDEILNSAKIRLKIGAETENYRPTALTRTESGTYLLSANISAAQMNEDIVIVITNGGAITNSVTYSARQYCDALLADERHSAYHALVKEMLHYGAMSQMYFGHNTDSLANDGISGAAAAEIPENADTTLQIDGKLEHISYYGASLVYRDRIAVRYYFNYSGDLADYTFDAGDKEISLDTKDGMVYVEIADILPQNLDQQITLTVTDTAGQTLTVTYGPMNYIVRMYQKNDVNLRNLLKALYNYHLAAKALQA